ncbi:MAG: Ig-like domain-containing protein [Candidatus Cloacimonetes bacterium]|nr:Ig-like domain-containing protein [Candidatus Cloacimonadota bacterium]
MKKVIEIILLLAAALLLLSCGSKKAPTGGPEDLQRPSVLSSLPAEFGQITDGRIEINFSKPLDKSSVTQAVYIYPPIQDKKITVDKSTLLIRFNEDLRPDTNYYVTVSTRLKDIRGNALPENQTLVFAHGDLNQFQLAGTVSFEDEADSSLPVQLRLLSADSLNVLSSVSRGPAYLLETLNPAPYLLRAYIDKDRNNRHDPDSEPFFAASLNLGRSQNLDIQLAYADSTKPVIKLAQARHQREVEILFSEPLAGYDAVTLKRLDTGGELPILITSLAGDKLTLLTEIQDAQTYRVEIRGARDVRGNLKALDKADFSSSQILDTTPPKVLASSPRNGTSVNTLEPTLELRFSEVIPASAIKASLKAAESNTEIPFNLSGENTAVYTFKPSQPLQNYRSYVLSVSAADISGNKLVEDYKLNFLPLLRSE